jgi:Xaa-Pro dipeptidase
MTAGVGGSSAAAELQALSPGERPPSITASERERRLERARALTAALGAEALLVGAGASLRYFTGVAWGATERLVALLLPVRGRPAMICPAFETGSLTAALAIDADLLTWEEHESPYALTAQALRDRGGRALALDPALPFGMYEALRRQGGGLELIEASAVIDGCRAIKSPAELALMSAAKAITLEVQRRAARMLQPGISTAEVRGFIDAAHRASGADGGSTFCIVQFGAATAFPHGLPGEQTLREGDVVLIDTGCSLDGYNADITRTYVFGEPSPDVRRIWDLEHAAQQAAFEAVRPGVPCGAIDAAARRVLEANGLGPDYRLPGLPHRTGHGIGLSIHEAPYLVRGDDTPLQPGMCFSNEPMIVVPGAFGVRLEDHFHVTPNGAAWFTQPSPSLERPFG